MKFRIFQQDETLPHDSSMVYDAVNKKLLGEGRPDHMVSHITKFDASKLFLMGLSQQCHIRVYLSGGKLKTNSDFSV
jgi:hypothetical protein